MVNNVVILGVTASTRLILDQEFPALKKVDVEPYNIRYSKFIPLSMKLLLDSSRISAVIKKEHKQLLQLVKDHKIDVVISDNRFGLYHQSIETVYITHQLNVKAGIWSALANRIHHRFIRKFTKVWVPDFEDTGKTLAGDLSRHPGLKVSQYLGPLSRLDPGITKTSSFDYLVLLSGVEPQRSILEEKLCEKMKVSSKKICLVRGTNVPFKFVLPKNVEVIDLPNALQLAQCIRNAETVICRSGYSTLMDLHSFNKEKLVLIPTPGQSEQLYLANYWQEKFKVHVVFQSRVEGWNFDGQFTNGL
ncbi:MAG: glycosyltransferase [Bacteroidota bacterium]